VEALKRKARVSMNCGRGGRKKDQEMTEKGPSEKIAIVSIK
jgi:hypothetical protein